MAEKSSFNVFEIIRTLIRYKKTLIIPLVFIFLLMIILLVFVVKPEFLSSATVKSTDSPFSLSGLIGGGAIPDLGDFGDFGGGAGAKELALYDEILKSRRCLEEVVIKFNLMEEYESKFLEDAILHFQKEMMVISINRRSGTMTIGAYHTNPETAKEIVNFLIKQLNKIYSEVSVLNAKQNREFIEARYNLVREDLRKYEDSLEVFQNNFGIAPDMQVQAAAKMEIELESEIKSEEVKLEILSKILSPNEPEIKAQKDKINILGTKLAEIQNSPFTDSRLNLKGSPEVILNFLRLKRELEIQNKILSTLIPLFEQSKIDEVKETPTVIVIDAPFVPEKKKRPKRTILVLMVMAVSFVSISSLIIIYDKFYLSFISKLKSYDS